MKKIALIAAALLSLSIAARAQEEPKDNSSWFVGAGLGMNFGFDGQRNTDRETSHNGAGIAGPVSRAFPFPTNSRTSAIRDMSISTAICSSALIATLSPTSTLAGQG